MENWLQNSEGYIVLLVYARDIPDKSIVRRPKGKTFYTLRTSMTVYNEPTPEARQTIYANEGTRLLIYRTGDASIVDGGKALVWYATPEQLLPWVQSRIQVMDKPADPYEGVRY